MTPASLLVLAFLDLFPLPVCTFALPYGAVMDAPACPPHDLGNDSGWARSPAGQHRCVRRFKI